MVGCRGGGILNYLIHKIIILIFVFALLTAGCAGSVNKSMTSCIEASLNVKVVRIDEQNHRLFLAGKGITAEDIRQKLHIIEKCLVSLKWGDEWALSLFTQEKYAGYKDEPRILPYHEGNAWAKAYIFEYDHLTRRLMKNPATHPEQVVP